MSLTTSIIASIVLIILFWLIRNWITKNRYKKNAQGCLSILRGKTNRYNYDLNLCLMLRFLKDGNLSLADIDTSEEETEQLRIDNYKFSAQGYLKTLRQGECGYESCLTKINCIISNLSKINLTLADIGTNEKELEKLRIEACKRDVENQIRAARKLAEKGKVSFANILGNVLTKEGVASSPDASRD